MELSVFQGAAETLARCKPILYLENDRQDKSPELIAYLQSAGYQLFWHTPSMYNASNYFHNAHNEFGAIVSVNMLGIHESIPTDIQGLRRVEGPDSVWQS